LPTTDPKNDTPSSFGLDVWCDPQEEINVLRVEIAAVDKDDSRRLAALYLELGRILLAAGNEPSAAEALLRSYTLRPQFRPTLRLARQIYRERADHRLVVKLFDAEGRATRDPLTRSALLRQQARLLWSRLGDVVEARKTLELAYRLDVTDLSTLKLLEVFYAAERDTDGLRAVLLRQLESVSDRSLRTALLVKIGLLAAHTDERAAVEALSSALKNEPHDLSVLSYLEQIYDAGGLYPNVVEVLVEQAEHPAVSAALRAKLLTRAARTCRDQLQDLDQACALFLRSLASLPVFGVAIDTFELLVAQRRFADAAAVGEKLFDLDDTPSLRAALACQIGDLQRTELKDNHAAATWYHHCLRWAPSYQPALEGLGWVLEATGDVDQLLAVHRADLANTKDPHALAQRLYRIAALLERHGRDGEALEIHREALSAWPSFKPSLSALERLFIRLERWTELLQLFDEELGSGPDHERMIHILETMASIWYHQIGHADNALDCYRRILEIAPQLQHILSATARLCAETRRWHDLVEITEREIAVISDPRRRVDLLQRSGEIWEDHLLNLDQAISCYTRALEIDPGFLPALKTLGRIYRQKGRWAELIQMHLAEIEITEDPEQTVALLYDVAEIYEEELLDEQQAAATYRTILERKPAHLPATAALGRILARRSDWRQLAQLRETSLDTMTDNRSKALVLWSVGVLREEYLGDIPGAIKTYNRALRLAPTLAPATAALDRLLGDSDTHQLAELYTAALEQAELPSERAAIAQRLADLHERVLGNGRKAAQLLERAVEVNPTAWDLNQLVEIYARLGLPRELCAALEAFSGALHDDRAAAEVQLRIARVVQESKIRDPLPYLGRALGLSSGRVFAQRATEQVLRQSGRRAELVDLLVERIGRTKDPLELSCLWTDLAEVHVGRGDMTGAETAFREAVRAAPSHLSALWGLERLLEEQKRWPELAELAEQEADGLEATRNLADALQRAATLWQDRVGDVVRAAPLYKRVLKVHPGHEEAFRRLHALLTAAGDWLTLASVIRAQITATSDSVAVVTMLVELAKLYLEQLRQPPKGMACLRRVLDLDANHLYALVTLGDAHYDLRQTQQAEELYARAVTLLSDGPERQRLSRRLGDIYFEREQPAAALDAYRQAAGGVQDPQLLRRIADAAEAASDFGAQVSALEKLAECSADAGERVQVRKQVAQLSEDILEQDERAVRALEEVLVLDPLDIEAIERLAAIYGRASNRSAVNQHLQASIEHHRAELARRPFDPRLYKQMGRIFQWQRSFDRLYCACLAQLFLGPLDDAEQRFLWDHHRRCAIPPRGPLARARYELLVLPDGVRGPLRDLLVAVGLNLQRRAAVTPEALGLDRSSKLKPEHPLRALCDEMAALLGGVDYDLLVSRTKPDLVAAEILTRPSLIVGARVAGNIVTASERFRIGRALFLLAENALVLRDLSVRQIRHLFAALGRVAQPVCTLPLAVKEEALLEEECKLLARVLSRKDRKVLGNVLPPMVGFFETVDLGEFARALSLGANRAGLMVAGDAKISLEEAGLSVGASEASPEMGDLLQYVVSEEYFTLRQELGLTPGSYSR
jgi:cellulose synthase operon protein C